MKKRKEMIYKYEAIFDPNGGGYTVTVPNLPGLVTEGDTLKEAREMVKDAIRCYLEAVLKTGGFRSPATHVAKRRMPIAVSV
jgi:predicted RNase H-like HicB family nuclease